MTEPKPCPFCASTEREQQLVNGEPRSVCLHCGAVYPPYDDYSNTRAETAEQELAVMRRAFENTYNKKSPCDSCEYDSSSFMCKNGQLSLTMSCYIDRARAELDKLEGEKP